MTDTMREALEPCPFCRDDMKINMSGMIEHIVQTPGCPIRQNAWPAERFLAAWNTRAALSTKDEGVEREKPFCATCGKDVHEITCPSCQKWWADNPPPSQLEPEQDVERQWEVGQRVTKRKGSSWTGKVVGFYSTRLTPEGYAVESENEPGSVQIYPAQSLSAIEGERK